jgi:hypothetical protein
MRTAVAGSPHSNSFQDVSENQGCKILPPDMKSALSIEQISRHHSTDRDGGTYLLQ